MKRSSGTGGEPVKMRHRKIVTLKRRNAPKAKRNRGRPRVGKGSKTISVTVEARLLAKTDQLAKKLQVPRAVLIARGLTAIVSEEVLL